MHFGLDDKTIYVIKELFQTFELIEKVIIFGSRAKGNFKNSSDIDFALIGKIENKELCHISNCLDELPTPYKFDILDYTKIDNENLKQDIDEFGKIFYIKNN